MNSMFQLNILQLTEIARRFSQAVQIGLEADGHEVKCLPTFIPLNNSLNGQETIVLDLGGTKIRAAIVSIENNKLNIQKGPVENSLLLKRGVPLSKDIFLKGQADLIASLEPPNDLPLGYCFSYPTKSTINGDATLIEWTKGISVHNTEDFLVGQTLIDFLKKNYRIRCSGVTVLNDTIASMLAGLAEDIADAYIGLIVGTGTNMALVIDSSFVKKLSAYCEWHGDIPINLESGNFYPQYLTHYDDNIDKDSENPGSQRFEKAVSGAYIGRIFKTVFPESDFDQESGSIGLVNLLNSATNKDHRKIAERIVKRSAHLIAASLAGLISFLIKNAENIRSICVVAEGGLIWGAAGYKEEVRRTSFTILKQLKLPEVSIDILRKDNANLIGSAYAALKKNGLHRE